MVLMAAKSAWDLLIETPDIRIGFMFDRVQNRLGEKPPRQPRAQTIALRSGEATLAQEQRALYRDTSGGAGYGERLAENVYLWGSPSYNRSPGTIMPPGRVEEIDIGTIIGSVRGAFELGNDLYVVFGQGGGAGYRGAAVMLPNGNGAPTVAIDFTASTFEPFSALTWEGNGYVGGAGTGIWKCDGTTRAWTQSVDVRRKYLETVDWTRGNSFKTRLVGSSVPGAIAYTWPRASILYTDNANPMTEAVWSEEIKVGNSEFTITNLVASAQHLYIGKTDGFYDLDDRLRTPNVTSYRKGQHERNDPIEARKQPILIQGGYAYFGSDVFGLDRVPVASATLARQDRPQQCHFGFGLPNTSPIGGEVRALANDLGWIAQAYYSPIAQTSYLVFGIDYRDLGLAQPAIGGPLLNHGAEAVFPDVKIEFIQRIAPKGADYAPELLLGGYRISAQAGVLYRMSLPRFGNPLQDLLLGGGMQFADEWVCTFPRDNLGRDGWIKDLTRVTVRGERLGDATLRAYVALDGDAFGDELGKSTVDYDYFPLDTETEARDWQFRVKGTGTTSAPALFKSLEAQGAVKVEANRVITYQVVAGLGTRKHTGDEDTRDMRAVEAALMALANRRCTVTYRGRTTPGRVLQAGLELQWEELPSGERTGRITASIPVLLTDEGWRLDSGRSLDSFLRLAG